eukprot:GILJ01037047.1.p1 GENE.GILJ01037047.1~~GILJ01037047.1.p1  ORF type:complete len:217 (+),score=42.27 GILJ01037047.1:498-1148(+)
MFTPKVVLAILLLIVGLIRTVHTLIYTFWLDPLEEEHANKRSTVYFGPGMVTDEVVVEECKRTAKADNIDAHLFDEEGIVIDSSPTVVHSDTEGSELAIHQDKKINNVSLPNRGTHHLNDDFSTSDSSESDSDFGPTKDKDPAKVTSREFTSDSADTIDIIRDRDYRINLPPLPSAEDGDVLGSSGGEMKDLPKKSTLDNDDDKGRVEIADEDFLF